MLSPSLRRAVIVMAVAATALMAASAASAANYVVMYKGSSVPASSKSQIERSGGTVVASYDAIGVVVARSLYDTFEAAIEQDSRVAGVARSERERNGASSRPMGARAVTPSSAEAEFSRAPT